MIKYIKNVLTNHKLTNLYYDDHLEVFFIGDDPDIFTAIDYNSSLIVLLQNNEIDTRDHLDILNPTL